MVADVAVVIKYCREKVSFCIGDDVIKEAGDISEVFGIT